MTPARLGTAVASRRRMIISMHHQHPQRRVVPVVARFGVDLRRLARTAAPRGAIALRAAERVQDLPRLGQSGHPGGKGGTFYEAQQICRQATPEAARVMVELLNSVDDRVRLMAADKVYERAFGKPKEYDPNESPGGGIDLTKLSDRDLAALIG